MDYIWEKVSFLMNLTDIKVYRLTHIDNISHILKYGITHRNSPNHNPNYLSIGDSSLIHTRDHKHVTVDNGDYLDFDAPEIILGQYIPFYFGVKMPMLYVIQNGGNFVPESTAPGKIIYMACSLNRIIDRYENYYFSDGHATDNLTTFYNKNHITDLPKIIDWDAVKKLYWGGNDNLNLKRKKQAEFLLKGDLNSDLIFGFGCYDETAKKHLLEMGIEESKIKVIQNAYF